MFVVVSSMCTRVAAVQIGLPSFVNVAIVGAEALMQDFPCTLHYIVANGHPV